MKSKTKLIIKFMKNIKIHIFNCQIEELINEIKQYNKILVKLIYLFYINIFNYLFILLK
jgi:hypothetical protein